MSGFCGSKIREARLKWFGQVQMKCVDTSVRRCERLDLGVTQKAIGRLKKYLGEVIRQDMMQLHIIKDMILNIKEWSSPNIRLVRVECCLVL